MDAAAAIPLNIGLAFRLAARSLKHRKMIALATLFGVAIGVGVVNAVLIVDANTVRTYQSGEPGDESSIETGQKPKLDDAAARQSVGGKSFPIRIENRHSGASETTIVPTQRGAVGGSGTNDRAQKTRGGRLSGYAPGRPDGVAPRVLYRRGDRVLYNAVFGFDPGAGVQPVAVSRRKPPQCRHFSDG